MAKNNTPQRTIYTYHVDVAGMNMLDERKLLALWLDYWRSEGFDPLVLNEYHAKQHPLYAELDRKIATFGTVNPTGYERACWMRHAAVSFAGGGFICDFDVFQLKPWERNRNLPKNKLTVFQGADWDSACPSLVFGTSEAYDAFLKFILERPDCHFAEVINGSNHYSDMHCIREFIKEGGGQIDQQVKNYNEPGWKEMKLVHCNRASLHPLGLSPRYKHIPELISGSLR